MNIKDDPDFEEAVRFLSQKMPPASQLVKPTLFHSLRVGISLYYKGYSKNVVIAGLLHDLIEDAGVSKAEIENKFGPEIAQLVQVESKDMSIQGESEKTEDVVKRCATHSEETAIIKAEDIIDNLNYFKQLDEPEKMDKLTKMGKTLLEHIHTTYSDKIFERLRKELVTL